jgi:glyoxylase-like metal-dependent hydrolase (beta-lactamase superfamily II)
MPRTPTEASAASLGPGVGHGTAITDLDRAWATHASGPRLRAVRVAAEGLRHRFAAGPRAVSVRTLPLVALPYPTKYAFFGAALSVAPYVLLTHRCVLVQFLQAGVLKTLLFNPTDVPGARATPFFARLAEHVPRRVGALVAHEGEPLADQLAHFGIDPADVDYVAFDHLHGQDLRPILGGVASGAKAAQPARFPNATLLVPRVEWEEWDDPHPLQRAWFVRDGRAGVDASGVAFTDGDVMLGDGAMLLRTPGHTPGNQTLFVNTSSGVWGISGNGTAADSWSPFESKIAGLRSFCRKHEVDVVMNANTPVRGADQYTSMVLEKTIADRLKRASAFAQVLPSSEVTPSVLSPGLKPTVLHRAVTHGEVALTGRILKGSGASGARPTGSNRRTKAPE